MSSTRSTTKAGAKKLVRPYGDTTGDGMVQVSFTLPVPHDKRAEGAALQLAAKMGMEPAMLVPTSSTCRP
jgi:beta-lysine 5,6-aminomutase beta subunit